MTGGEEDSFADEAWSMLARPVDPMPAYAVVDWLRQEMDTDDVADVKLALYRAAARAMRATPDPYHTWQAHRVLGAIRTGRFNRVRGLINDLRDTTIARNPLAWAAWFDAARNASALCQRVERTT